jgi:hypothetical protein
MPPFADACVGGFGPPRLLEALELIADIAEGSRTINSLPHIAKIARAAITAQTASLRGDE